MGWFSKRLRLGDDFPEQCRAYLEAGPPGHMTNYVPESLTEIIIAYGAESRELDPELLEIGHIILMESSDFDSYEDPEIREYMERGARLVAGVLARDRAR